MSDPLALLKSLRRPRLLIRAARFGTLEYRRERDLKRLMKCDTPPSPRAAVDQLLVEEDRLERIRQSGEASYSISRHVDVLIALISEAKLASRCISVVK